MLFGISFIFSAVGLVGYLNFVLKGDILKFFVYSEYKNMFFLSGLERLLNWVYLSISKFNLSI